MMRSILLLALMLTACNPVPADLSPEAAMESYREALFEGDTDRAVALLEHAADAGNWKALEALTNAHERGHLAVPYDADRKGAGFLAFTPRPGSGRFVRARYEYERERAARRGDPEALYSLGFATLGSNGFINGRLDSDPDAAALDSARAIYRQLVASDLPRLQLAMMAKAVGDTLAHDRHIREAAKAGEPQGCWFLAWFTGDRPDMLSTRGIAEHYEMLLDCDASNDARRYVATGVRGLQTESARGNAKADVALDSLNRLGFFERHPEILALASDA